VLSADCADFADAISDDADDNTELMAEDCDATEVVALAAELDVASTEEVLDSDEVDAAANTATGGGVGLALLDESSVLLAERASDTVDETDIEVVNAEDCDDVVEEPKSASQNEGDEVVEASVVLSGGATAVLRLLLPIVVEKPLGSADTVSKTVSSMVTVLCSVVVEERGLAGGGGGGADEASSCVVDLDPINLDEEVVVFMKLDATSRGRRPASRRGGYFNASAVGVRMDAKASVAVHARMEFFIVKDVKSEK